MPKELVDLNATFYTTGDGLKGCYVEIMEGDAKGERKRIIDNSPTRLTLDSAFTEDPTGYPYQIGNIDFRAVSKEFDGSDFGYQSGMTLNFNRPMIIECDEQAEIYSTGKAILTNGSTTVTATDSASWDSAYRGENLFIPGYNETEHFIKTATSSTLTLTTAWAGDTGVYEYYIGAKLLKVEYYLNGENPMDNDTAYKTVYANMASNPVNVPIQCICKSLIYRVSNNRVNESVKIHAITIPQPALWGVRR